MKIKAREQGKMIEAIFEALKEHPEYCLHYNVKIGDYELVKKDIVKER